MVLYLGKLGDKKEETIKKISELIGVSEDYINKQLSASYVKDDTFVPVKKVAKNNIELKEKLLQIPGILINSTEARIYPYGEETSHLVGYIQSISKEELEKNSGKGYSSTSVIGKSGLELIYEEKLRGIDGKEIYIEDESGNKVKTLAFQEKKDGENLKLTIDSNLQKKVYELMKDDKGLFVIMNPKTGELLSLVSTPSYDSNDFILGMTNEKWDELNKNEENPLLNRYLQSYCPGSTFKPITAAIGLQSGKLTKDTIFDYSGLKWQKNKSWGDVYITTLTGYSDAKNIRNALIHSDNIFFGRAAMEIGSKTFCSELDKLGFNQELEFPINLSKSQYGNISDEKN